MTTENKVIVAELLATKRNTLSSKVVDLNYEISKLKKEIETLDAIYSDVQISVAEDLEQVFDCLPKNVQIMTRAY